MLWIFRWKAIWKSSIIINARTYTYNVTIFYNAYLNISCLINSFIAYIIKFSSDLKEYIVILEKLENKGQKKQFQIPYYPLIGIITFFTSESLGIDLHAISQKLFIISIMKYLKNICDFCVTCFIF